ncbi:MAG: YccF domain-containing protein, partial [Anaerolineae bacterium]|nr:YccF domain-containing protein [Anaerolineae bacterium]
MSFIGNILWLIFGGFIAGMGYIIGGLLLCLTIIGIPFGLQSIRIGFANFAPFGKQITEAQRSGGCLGLVFDIIWVVLFGWEIALAHLISAGILAITIVGIPFAMQHLKLI